MKNAKKQKSLLVKNADYLVTMDKERRILRKASVYCEGSEIKEIDSKRRKADRIIDASGMIMLPGLINTHHHLFQSLFRGIDKLKKQQVISWIRILSKLSQGLKYEAAYIASLTGLAELVLSGCTTCSDFSYLYPMGRNDLFDATVNAASDIGIRFHPVRGYVEKAKDGIWPDFVTQEREEVLSESQRVIDKHHDSEDFSMCQVALGPCGHYSTSTKLFKEICELARKKRVRLHTHFAETPGERISLLQSTGCLGKDVWLAHVIYVNPEDIAILAKTGTSVAYCPICNMAKKQVAPIIQMAKKGIKIGIGVDGSASNDSSNILIEGRIAGRLQGLNRETSKVSYLRATQILEMLTLGGAVCLGRSKILGSLEENKAADLVLINITNKIECSGAHNPLEATFHTGLSRVDYTIINGKVIVKQGHLTTVNLPRLIKKQNTLSREISKKTEKDLGESLSLDWISLLID